MNRSRHIAAKRSALLHPEARLPRGRLGSAEGQTPLTHQSRRREGGAGEAPGPSGRAAGHAGGGAFVVDARPVLGSSAAGGSDREGPELARAQRVGRKRAFQKRVCTYPPTPPSSPILFNRSIYCNLTISPCLRSAAFHCAVQPGPLLRREGAGGGTDPWPPARRREVGPRRRPLRLFFLPLALVTERPGLCTLGILQDWWGTSWACTRPPCLSFVAKRQSAVFLDRRCFPLPHTPVSLCVHTACFTLSLNSSPGLPLPSPGPQAPRPPAPRCDYNESPIFGNVQLLFRDRRGLCSSYFYCISNSLEKM